MSQAILENGLATTAGNITVHNYDNQTTEYLCSSDEYLAFGVGIPAHSTTDAPPTTKSNYTACYQQEKWQHIADYRGTVVYDTTTGQQTTITELGEIPDNVTQLAPATEFDKWDGAMWVTDTDAQQAAAEADALRYKQTELDIAHTAISVLQARLMLDRASDAEKQQLHLWLDYVDTLNAVDITRAPNIEWPVAPA